MFRRKFKYFAAIVIMPAFTSANADINIHEGEWEITSKIEMSGMPVQINIGEQKITQCIDKQKIVPKTDKKINQYCTISGQNIEGDRVTWKMTCTNNIHSEGSITYHGDTCDGEMTTITEVPEMGKMTMIVHMKGKRIGECTK